MEVVGKQRRSEWQPCTRKDYDPSSILSTTEHVKFCGKLPEPSGKAKYSSKTDSERVLWRKGEKNPEQGSEKDPETVCLQAVEAIRGDGVPFA